MDLPEVKNAISTGLPHTPTRAMAVKIAICYASVGGLWILVSGWLLHHLVHDPTLEALLETVKGWFYVLSTALLLGFALDKYFRSIRHSTHLLQLSEARYRLVSENSSDVIWLFDIAANRFSYVSPSVERLRGFSVAEVMRQKPEEMLTPESYRLVYETLPDRLNSFARGDESARSRTHEVFQLRKDGSAVPTEVVSTLIADDQRRATHIQGVSRDISERKRLEAQIRQGQKLEAIGQLAGGVAHDFNNILAAILMRLDLLRSGNVLNGELLRGLNEMETETRRAADLTRQLLMFSRRSVLDAKPLDLNGIVENLMKMLSRLIGEHINLRFDGGPNLPCVEADAGMLEQVLMNLVINARDAMPQGGNIVIATSFVRVDAARAASCNDRRPGDFLCLTVADTGCGMDPETIKKIFDPFFTTKELGKGTGLGLSTVHGIVAQHKGWIEVESDIGRGTTFRVFLPPVSAKCRKSDVPSRKFETAQGGEETILVVEDDESLRSLAARMLRKRGYGVIEAGTGRKALELWQSHGSGVDLVLTDMVMPEGMTGLELIDQLQILKPGLKAIVASGYSSDIVQAGLPARTGVAFLPKPYESKTLAKAVRECLDGKSSLTGD